MSDYPVRESVLYPVVIITWVHFFSSYFHNSTLEEIVLPSSFFLPHPSFLLLPPSPSSMVPYYNPAKAELFYL